MTTRKKSKQRSAILPTDEDVAAQSIRPPEGEPPHVIEVSDDAFRAFAKHVGVATQCPPNPKASPVKRRRNE